MASHEHFAIIADDTSTALALLDDCNCACPAPAPATAAAAAAALPPHALVACHPQQQTIALNNDYSALFVPSLSRVVVVNAAVLAWLPTLHTPQPLASLSAPQQQAAAQLYAQGVLVQPGALSPPPPPDELIVWLHVTNACNLRCTYCYIHKSDEAMEADTAAAALDAIWRTAHQHGYRKIALKYAGGEAALNIPRIEQIHSSARQRAQQDGFALRGVVLSNGVGLTRHTLATFQRLGLQMMISLDGPEAIHNQQRPRLGGQGSFRAARASIQRAHQMGLELTVSITITGASAPYLADMLGWLLEDGIHFTLNFYRECAASTSRQELQLDEQQLIAGMRAAYQVIEQHLPRYSLLGCLLDRTHLGASHQRTCAVGEHYLVIDQRGSVAKCQMDIENPVTTVWAHDPLRALRQDTSGVQNLPVEQKTGCRDCVWRSWCAGGCALVTYRATGRYDVQSPNCGIYTALYPDVIRLEGLRLLRHHAPSST